MPLFFSWISLYFFSLYGLNDTSQKAFDVHLHGSNNIDSQVTALRNAGVYKVAVSSSWQLQQQFSNTSGVEVLQGLMFPCPAGKVPYSLQTCFDNAAPWPDPSWVEQQVVEGKIDFFGEVLTQYFGISSSDSLLFPYYRLAEKYSLPVGIHTGGAGPDHGSPHFKMELGDPALLKPVLQKFPGLKVWIMHGGDQFFMEAIALMQDYKNVYADISVLCNPYIVPPERFAMIVKAFVAAGLEDRLLFGTDNAPAAVAIAAVQRLPLTALQRQKIFYRNAEQFFAKKKS